MNSLRFLLVHRNPEQSEKIASLLGRANHTVLPTSGFEEAADALTVERFDAILMDSEFRQLGLQAFSDRLRKMEQSQKCGTRVPLLALVDGDAAKQESGRNETTGCAGPDGVDGVIQEPIDPAALTAEVIHLAQAVARSMGEPAAIETPSTGILDPEKFREQVGYDSELMVEIINLFLEERKRQEPEMQQALMAKQFELLSRIAHTIKGSLGSLHATRARQHAQELELAAKKADEDVCWTSLAALETDLAELEPELLALR